jgi:hypothetical protein
MNTSKTIKRLLRVSILLKMSLISISILVVSGCLPFTIVGGVLGVGDSMHKSNQIEAIIKRLNRLEKSQQRHKINPYIPSYVDMDTFKKGIYDK